MGDEDRRLRSDLSFTLFLSDPASYEGGELVLEGTDGERAVKPAAGALVVYSTGALHGALVTLKDGKVAAHQLVRG